MITIEKLKAHFGPVFAERFGPMHVELIFSAWHESLMYKKDPPNNISDITPRNIAELTIFMAIAQPGNEFKSLEAALNPRLFPMIGLLERLFEGTNSFGGIENVAEILVQPAYCGAKIFSLEFDGYVFNHIGEMEDNVVITHLDHKFLMNVYEHFIK